MNFLIKAYNLYIAKIKGINTLVFLIKVILLGRFRFILIKVILTGKFTFILKGDFYKAKNTSKKGININKEKKTQDFNT